MYKEDPDLYKSAPFPRSRTGLLYRIEEKLYAWAVRMYTGVEGLYTRTVRELGEPPDIYIREMELYIREAGEGSRVRRDRRRRSGRAFQVY